MHTRQHHTRAAGFTLMEVIIVMVVVAILVSIAVPSYQNYVLKSHRVSAKTALLDLANRQESYYALNNTYASQANTLGLASSTLSIPGGGQNYYLLSVASATTSSFTLQAMAQGGQASDACQSYRLDNLGNQSNINASGVTLSVSNCW